MNNELAESRIENTKRSNDAAASHALSNESLSLSKLNSAERKPQSQENLSLPSLELTDKSKAEKLDGQNSASNQKQGDTPVKKENGEGNGVENKSSSITELKKNHAVDLDHSTADASGKPNVAQGDTGVSKHKAGQESGLENKSGAITDIKKQFSEFFKEREAAVANSRAEEVFKVSPSDKPAPLKHEMATSKAGDGKPKSFDTQK